MGVPTESKQAQEITERFDQHQVKFIDSKTNLLSNQKVQDSEDFKRKEFIIKPNAKFDKLCLQSKMR